MRKISYADIKNVMQIYKKILNKDMYVSNTGSI